MFKIKKLTLLFCLILIFTMGSCTKSKENNKLTVAVSITPQATFAEKICGDKANIITMIPSGASAENYEMSPKEITTFNDSDIYFSIGVPAEKSGILPHLGSQTKLFDLAGAVLQKYPEIKIGVERDPHIWLSPKRSIVIVEEMKKQISALDPANAEFYKKNADDYINELNSLEKEIQNLFKDKKKKMFFISHPSYGYLAADYGLEMIVLEKHGQEATAKDLAQLITKAKESNTKVIFCQEEASKKQAEIFAKEIGGKVEILKPLSHNYIESLREAAALIYEAVN